MNNDIQIKENKKYYYVISYYRPSNDFICFACSVYYLYYNCDYCNYNDFTSLEYHIGNNQDIYESIYRD